MRIGMQDVVLKHLPAHAHHKAQDGQRSPQKDDGQEGAYRRDAACSTIKHKSPAKASKLMRLAATSYLSDGNER